MNICAINKVKRMMVIIKRIIKIILGIFGIVIVIILLDSIQAIVFNNDPIIGMQMWCKKKKGILVETYHCDNGKKITRIKKNNTCNYEDVCK